MQIFTHTMSSIVRYMLRWRGWLAGWKDVCLSDVCRVHPVGGWRVRPAGWMAGIGWSRLAQPAWLKVATARFRCRPLRAISWWPPAYSLLCPCPLGALSDDAVWRLSVCLSHVTREQRGVERPKLAQR